MGPTVRSFVARYGVAVLAVVVALLVRQVLDPLLGNRLPFLTFAVAIMAVAWHGGFGPSCLALLLGLFVAAFFFLQPRYSLGDSLAGHSVQVMGFVFLGLSIGVFSEALLAARRRAEAQALSLQEEVLERQRLGAELAETDRRKDEFLAMLAHELRNPLAPLRNAVHLFRMLGPGDANLQRVGGIIERQVLHLTRLVDDLLDVSRITRGKIELHTEPIDLAAVVACSVEASRPLLDARRHELTVQLPGQPLWVEGDATRLTQVLGNLLNNAAKYTPEGGHICLTVEAGEKEATVRVRDDGRGIAADFLPRVFDLFTQGDPSPARSEGGLGIGLTLVKSLVGMHGGRVEAHSDGPGHGSEFVVRLPLLPMGNGEWGSGNEKQSTSVIPHSPLPIAHSRRVLVVDDNADAADSLATLLRVQGHEVHAAADGPGALREVEGWRPQVVLLDIGLPGMDGYEVARRLREQAGWEQVLLVAVTGYGQEEDRRKALEAGFDAHLVKPADPGVLQELLARGRPAGAR